MSEINPAIQSLVEHRVIPVIALPDADLAEPLGDALVEAGLPCAEITFRTPAAVEGIRRLASRGDLAVSAGTVLSIEQAERATDAGARCLLSPGFDAGLQRWCIDRGVTMIPGVATPTEVQKAMGMGIGTLKFFPAEPAGGPAMLNALAGPFSEARFIPTGGVSRGNLGSYLSLSNVLACGGSWMVKRGWLASRDFDAIRTAASDALRLANDASA